MKESVRNSLQSHYDKLKNQDKLSVDDILMYGAIVNIFSNENDLLIKDYISGTEVDEILQNIIILFKDYSIKKSDYLVLKSEHNKTIMLNSLKSVLNGLRDVLNIVNGSLVDEEERTLYNSIIG